MTSKKIIAIFIIPLFISLSFIPSINANVSEVELDIPPEETINKKKMLYQKIQQLAEEMGYQEKPSDDNCGCNDGEPTRWSFPCICTLLYPVFIIFFIIAIVSSNVFYPIEILMHIGSILDCFWYNAIVP